MSDKVKEAEAIGKLLEKFEEVSKNMEKMFPRLNANFELKDGVLDIKIHADNEPW